MTGLIGACAGIVMIPVLSILWTALTEGITQLNVYFLTHNMRGVVGGTWPYGGIFHALIGTVEITLATMLICAPLGVATAIFLEEYARGASAGRVATKFANAVSMVVDVMSGIPSILAGLFAYSLFATLGGAGTVNGFVGVVALSVLALPTVVKASQESLRRVPNELRENALALGASRAVMVRKVVVRTALPGLVSAVILAVARIIGETAPLVITAGIVDSTNFNLFSGRMATLPTYIYNEYSQGLATCSTVQMHAANPCLPGIRMERAWAAGLVLVVVVVVLNAIGHAVARKVAVAQK
jgi:phosphate transport system permease protein